MADAADDSTGCRKYLKYFVYFIKGLTLLSLLANVVSYGVIIDAAINSSLNAVDKAFTLLGNTGFIVLCVFLGIAEFEPAWFIKHVVIMHYWAARGFWILWMGIQTIATSKQLSAAVGDSGDVDKGLLELLGVITGSIMIACGLIYCIFSLLCIRSFTEAPSELSQPLAGGSVGDTADAILAANLALALGMTPAEAKKKFSKDKGAREAQKYAQTRAEEIAQMKGRLAEMQKVAADASKAAGSAAGAAAASRAAADVSKTYGSVNAGNGRGTTPPPAASSASACTPAAHDDDDDNPRRGRGGDDEDELMRQYYANAKFDH